MQKSVRITDQSNRDRYARQIFLPRPWEYQQALVPMQDGVTDIGLLNALKTFGRSPLPFEI